MPCAVTMKDVLIIETVDEDFSDVMQALNASITRGIGFMALDDMQGTKVMFNIPNIMTIKEIED
jgi:hypothetical protein